MNLYVQMTDDEYELFKQFRKHPNLVDHNSADLTSALLQVIKKEGGQVETASAHDNVMFNDRSTTTMAKVKNSNFIISLIVQKV